MKSIRKEISKLNKSEKKMLSSMIGMGILSRDSGGSTLHTRLMVGVAEYGAGQGPTGASRQTAGKRSYLACETLVKKGLAVVSARNSSHTIHRGYRMTGYCINIKPTSQLVEYISDMAIWEEDRTWKIGLSAPLDLDPYYKVGKVA